MTTTTNTTVNTNAPINSGNVDDFIGTVCRYVAPGTFDTSHTADASTEVLIMGRGESDDYALVLLVTHYPDAERRFWSWGSYLSDTAQYVSDGGLVLKPCAVQPEPREIAQQFAKWLGNTRTDQQAAATQARELVDELSTARGQIGELRRKLWVNGTDYGVTMQQVYDRLLQEAENREWCVEFDEVMDDLGLPTREAEYVVEVEVSASYTTTVRVTAHNEDEASGIVNDGDRTSELTRALVEALRYDSTEIDFEVNSARRARD